MHRGVLDDPRADRSRLSLYIGCDELGSRRAYWRQGSLAQAAYTQHGGVTGGFGGEAGESRCLQAAEALERVRPSSWPERAARAGVLSSR
jgi:hypothetical protein